MASCGLSLSFGSRLVNKSSSVPKISSTLASTPLAMVLALSKRANNSESSESFAGISSHSDTSEANSVTWSPMSVAGRSFDEGLLWRSSKGMVIGQGR